MRGQPIPNLWTVVTRIAIIEDDPLVARQMADVVAQTLGHEPVMASVGETGPIDAAIVGLRGRTGPAIVAQLRERDPRLPVIAVCAADDADAFAEAAALVGPLAVVTRPVQAAELLPRLAAALERAALAGSVDELTREIAARDHALASTSSELATATERLMVAEQLAAVGRVVTGIAHELGQQLALVGYAEAIKARVAADPELVELADVIVGAQRRLLAMVDSMRDFSDGQDRPLLREPADLVAIVDEALALLRHDPDVRRRVVTRAIEGHPLCLCHHAKLAQVVINLVHNAALATAAGDAIELRVGLDHGGRARITVADHGVGMAPEIVARLGEPFFTTRGDRGSGLGVGICRRIVEDHGGTLAFASAPGQGTTATVCLPILDGGGRA